MFDAQPAVRRATTADAGSLGRLMGAAFFADAPTSWLFPEAEQRRRLSPLFFGAFVDLALEGGEAHTTVDGSGVALWFDVDIERPAPEPTDLHERLVRELGSECAQRFLAIDELFAANHPTRESHAYLAFVAVAPQRQSTGIGAALIRNGIAHLDAAGRPSYLEATSPLNAALYRRLGYAPAGPDLVIEGGPTFHPMWRPVGGTP